MKACPRKCDFQSITCFDKFLIYTKGKWMKSFPSLLLSCQFLWSISLPISLIDMHKAFPPYRFCLLSFSWLFFSGQVLKLKNELKNETGWAICIKCGFTFFKHDCSSGIYLISAEKKFRPVISLLLTVSALLDFWGKIIIFCPQSCLFMSISRFVWFIKCLWKSNA